MYNRWCSEIHDLNLAFSNLHRLVQQLMPKRKGRGRKPKRSLTKYVELIVLKEYDERTLRGAESHLSRYVCNERVDHSVIAYWENKEEVRKIIAEIVSLAGALLQKNLSSIFTFVDATKFSNWKWDEFNIHVCNKIANGTLYPVGISFLTKSVSEPVYEAVPNGSGLAYLDAGYDDNKTIGVMFRKGYTPIVCPNKGRFHGYWRRKARKLYRMPEHRLGYRQRGRGESLFGSLTNQFGDRLNVKSLFAMQTRVASRVVCYQIKLLIRLGKVILLGIIRHALILFVG